MGSSPQSLQDTNAPRTLAWSGSGLLARFTQSTTLTVRQSFDGASRAILAVSIDGGPPTLLAAAQTTVTSRGLDPAVIHTVTITKRTEPMFGASVIEGLSLDAPGTWLAPPPAAVRRLEVIGDGTSIGFGIAGAPGCAGAASDEDATAAFASLAAATVGAEVRLSAWTGSGVLDNNIGNHAHATNNGADSITLAADGNFAFAPGGAGAAYHVTVAQQPDHQVCTVQGGDGAITTALSVQCVPAGNGAFSVGGVLSGLARDQNITLENNASDLVTLWGDGNFTFPAGLAAQGSYSVAISAAPAGQSCALTDASGTLAGADYRGVAVACLNDVDVPAVTLGGNGSFVVASDVPPGETYDITVTTPPPGYSCDIAQGRGTIVAASKYDVLVICAPRPATVGGALFGVAPGDTLQLTLGYETLSLDANTVTFQFATTLPYGSPYAVRWVPSVEQRCTITGDPAAGTVGAADITGLVVSCTPNHYTLGGAVIGLVGPTPLTVTQGSETLTLSNGPYAFATPLLANANYQINVVQVTGQYSNSRTTWLPAAANANRMLPSGLASDGVQVAVADPYDHRVLLFAASPRGMADVVLGQPDFTTCQPSPAPDAVALSGAQSIWTDGVRLLVADTNHHRVLVWDTWPTQNGQPADHVLGQGSFTSPVPGAGSQGLNTPMSVTSEGTHVIVADTLNHRVAIWSGCPGGAGAPYMQTVLGQSDVMQKRCNQGAGPAQPSATTLCQPTGVAIVGYTLAVTDTSNHRLAIYR